MYLNNLVAFRCPKELYEELKQITDKDPNIENISHAIRIAVIKYIRENKTKVVKNE